MYFWLLFAHSYQISVGTWLKGNHISGRYAYNVLLLFSGYISEFNYDKSVSESHVDLN